MCSLCRLVVIVEFVGVGASNDSMIGLSNIFLISTYQCVYQSKRSQFFLRMSFKFQLSTKVRVISIFSWPMLALPKSQCCRKSNLQLQRVGSFDEELCTRYRASDRYIIYRHFRSGSFQPTLTRNWEIGEAYPSFLAIIVCLVIAIKLRVVQSFG